VYLPLPESVHFCPTDDVEPSLQPITANLRLMLRESWRYSVGAFFTVVDISTPQRIETKVIIGATGFLLFTHRDITLFPYTG
jgi:hypothetical protein